MWTNFLALQEVYFQKIYILLLSCSKNNTNSISWKISEFIVSGFSVWSDQKIILSWKLLLGNLERGENFNWKVMWRCYFHAISLLWPLMTFSAYIAAKPLLLRLFTVLLKWKRKRKNILHTSYIAQGFFNLNLLKFGPFYNWAKQCFLLVHN